MATTTRSKEIFELLQKTIPGGVNSPVRASKAVGGDPLIVERGEGAMVYDADDNGYIDYIQSWGALIHGHAHPQVTEAVCARAQKGSSFGMSTEIEARLASKIISLMPSIEKVRFVNSGTEATMSATRLARGFTGRQTVLKFSGNYHGHADFFLVKAGSGVAAFAPEASSAGVPHDAVGNTLCCTFNDLEGTRQMIRSHGDELAAVILEPVAGNMGVVAAAPEFLQMIREETKACGALFIFDEVMTCFRVAKGGAQALYGITPDLTCLGKIVGGGYPVAAFGGRAEIMDYLAPTGPVYQAGTLSGFPLGMEAGLQTLSLVDQDGFYEQLECKAKRLAAGFEEVIAQEELNACVQRVGAMLTLFLGKRKVTNFEEALQCDQKWFADFYWHMRNNGVNLPPLQFEAWFLSAAHSEQQIDHTIHVAAEFLRRERR